MSDRLKTEKVLRYVLCGGAIALALQLSTASAQQSLNDATTAQLAKRDVVIDPNNTDPNKPCGLLLGTDDPNDPNVLLDGGQLQVICNRGNQPVVNPSSGGGGAATPPSRPAAVEARLDDEGDEEDDTSARGFFFTLGDDSVDRVVSALEDGYQSDVQRIAAGFDKTFGRSWIAVIAADMSEQEGDFVGGGNFEIKQVGITGYGSRLIGENASFDFYFGLAQLSNDRQRIATFSEIVDDPNDPFDFPFTLTFDGTPTADYDADQTLLGIQYSRDWARDNFTFGPRFGFDWNETSYDTYNEVDDSGLALTFYDDEETSAQFSAGLAGSLALSTNFGVVVLHETLTYRYETDQDQRDVEVSFVEDVRPTPQIFTYQTESPDRDFLEFAIGATFVLRNGLQVLTEFGGITSHEFLDSNAFVVGFRKEL